VDSDAPGFKMLRESPAMNAIIERRQPCRFRRSRALNAASIDNLMCVLLRGEVMPWPYASGAGAIDDFLSRADYHGVKPLLHERLKASNWPEALLQSLREQALAAAGWELRHRQLLMRTLAALADIGIQPVLFKGTALAYSLYASPVLRARGDTDLIVPPDSLTSTDAALSRLGFDRDLAVAGEFVSYQANYSWQADGREPHTLDLHWRINNSEVLANLFSYEELRASAQALPKLSSQANGAGPVHALLLACMHRATHKQNPMYVDGVAHYGGDRLIWLYDIHLLAGAFSSLDWDEFVRLADGKGLRAVCLEGMERARACFGTQYPENVLAALGRAGRVEAPAVYLESGKSRQQWLDFCAIPGAGSKLRFLRELGFPSAAYMSRKYPDARPAWLPWLYLRRALGGVLKKVAMRKA
jgi:hypothetical protein